jgi:hypothetical protein
VFCTWVTEFPSRMGRFPQPCSCGMRLRTRTSGESSRSRSRHHEGKRALGRVCAQVPRPKAKSGDRPALPDVVPILRAWWDSHGRPRQRTRLPVPEERRAGQRKGRGLSCLIAAGRLHRSPLPGFAHAASDAERRKRCLVQSGSTQLPPAHRRDRQNDDGTLTVGQSAVLTERLEFGLGPTQISSLGWGAQAQIQSWVMKDLNLQPMD